MSWPHYKPTITVMDLLESGACYDGVTSAVLKHKAIVAPTEKHAGNEHVAEAANASGSGYGYGYGSGDGDGYGYGDGYGDGDGDGYGDGYGSG